MLLKLFFYALSVSILYFLLILLAQHLTLRSLKIEKLKLIKVAFLHALIFFVILCFASTAAHELFSFCQLESDKIYDYPKLCTDPFGHYFIGTPVLLMMGNVISSFLTLKKLSGKMKWFTFLLNLLICSIATAVAMFASLYMT